MKKIVLFFCCLPVFGACSQKEGNPSGLLLLISSYGEINDSTIAVCSFDTLTGDLKLAKAFSGFVNPSYLVVSPDERMIYAVSETGEGGVYSIAFDKRTLSLNLLNCQSTTSADPCYINIDRGKNFIVTANYSGGSLSVFPLSEKQTVQPLSLCMDMNLPGEKESPPSHIHTAIFSPDGRRLFATDLGKDKIYRFKVDAEAKADFLIRDKEKTTSLAPGSGPRHLVFHPGGKFLYCINELSGTVAVFEYHDDYLTNIQYIASDTTSGTGGKGSADIHISPDGKFLYSSNRLKADGIAVFSIHPETGLLTRAGYRATGTHPRNFILSPNGKFLLCANRDGNTVQVFERDEKTGLLHDTGKGIHRSKPVCLKWMEKTEN